MMNRDSWTVQELSFAKRNTMIMVCEELLPA